MAEADPHGMPRALGAPWATRAQPPATTGYTRRLAARTREANHAGLRSMFTIMPRFC